MDIEAAVARRIQHRLRQNQPIGGNHRNIGPERGEFGLFVRALERSRMPHENAQFISHTVHRGRSQLLAAPPARARRLSINRHQLMPRVDQRAQRWHGEVWGAHENDAQSYSSCSQVPLPIGERLGVGARRWP